MILNRLNAISNLTLLSIACVLSLSVIGAPLPVLAENKPIPTIRIQSHAMRTEPNAVDTISITISLKADSLQVDDSSGYAGSSNSLMSGIAGFDFTLAYDRETFDLIEALPGAFPDSCNWEYFVERDNPKCPSPCPRGLFKIVGLVKFMGLDSVEVCQLPPTGGELVKLVLKRKSTTRRRTIPGVPSEPLRFFWIDCGDNSVASNSGNELFLAQSVFDADGSQLPENTFARFPNYTGPTGACFDSGRENAPKPRLKFINALIVSPVIERIPTRDSL